MLVCAKEKEGERNDSHPPPPIPPFQERTHVLRSWTNRLGVFRVMFYEG